MFSFQNVWPIERKAVYTLLLFHIFILAFPNENWIGSQLAFFLKVNLQVVAVDKKSCFRWYLYILPVTA